MKQIQSNKIPLIHRDATSKSIGTKVEQTTDTSNTDPRRFQRSNLRPKWSREATLESSGSILGDQNNQSGDPVR